MHKNDSGLIEVNIDDEKYEFEKWGAELSLATLMKISKIIGKPFGMLLGQIMSGGIDVNLSPDLLGDACEALVSNMDEAVAIALIKRLSAEKILCNGKKINFDIHYQDKLPHLFNVVKAALEVQYGNFLGELLGLIKVKDVLPTKKISNKRAI